MMDWFSAYFETYSTKLLCWFKPFRSLCGKAPDAAGTHSSLYRHFLIICAHACIAVLLAGLTFAYPHNKKALIVLQTDFFNFTFLIFFSFNVRASVLKVLPNNVEKDKELFNPPGSVRSVPTQPGGYWEVGTAWMH